MKIEKNIIYCMDCIQGMKNIPDESVDIIVTDPPYNINLKPQRGLTEAIENDNMSEEDFKVFLKSVFSEVNRVLKPNSFLVIFTGWSTIPLFRSVLDGLFTLKSMPVWVKNNFGIGYYTRPQYEPAFLYFKGKPETLINPVSDVWKFNKVLSPVHSCEKPLKLMRFILKVFGKEGQTVLDPFGGVGAVYKASKELNMDFYGFELEQRYVDIANKKLEQDNIKNWFEVS